MNPRERRFTLALIFLAACLALAAGDGAHPQGGVTMPLELKSPDFTIRGKHSETIHL